MKTPTEVKEREDQINGFSSEVIGMAITLPLLPIQRAVELMLDIARIATHMATELEEEDE